MTTATTTTAATTATTTPADTSTHTAVTMTSTQATNNDRVQHMEFDLLNLAAFDPTPVDLVALRSNPNEYLKEISRQGVQELVRQMFDLPSEPAEVGALAELPKSARPVTLLPRAKPIPQPKAKTKWQEFAERKGIVKRKRERMVWDEENKDWRPRWGYKRVSNDQDQWVLEVKNGEDPYADPFENLAQAKKQRIEKNERQRIANVARAAKGTGDNRLPGAIDMAAAASGTELGTPRVKRKQKNVEERTHTDVALTIAQHSTASMGKFDKPRDNEPQMKPEKRARHSTEEQDVASEKSRNLKLLQKMLGNGDDVDVQKAAKNRQRQHARDDDDADEAPLVANSKATNAKKKGGKPKAPGKSKAPGRAKAPGRSKAAGGRPKAAAGRSKAGGGRPKAGAGKSKGPGKYKPGGKKNR